MVLRKPINRVKILNRDGAKCSDCGKSNINGLVIAVKDGNKLNTNPENLYVCCRSCLIKKGYFGNVKIKYKSLHPEILEMRNNGMKFKDIAEKTGITHQRAQQIYDKLSKQTITSCIL